MPTIRAASTPSRNVTTRAENMSLRPQLENTWKVVTRVTPSFSWLKSCGLMQQTSPLHARASYLCAAWPQNSGFAFRSGYGANPSAVGFTYRVWRFHNFPGFRLESACGQDVC